MLCYIIVLAYAAHNPSMFLTGEEWADVLKQETIECKSQVTTHASPTPRFNPTTESVAVGDMAAELDVSAMGLLAPSRTRVKLNSLANTSHRLVIGELD